MRITHLKCPLIDMAVSALGVSARLQKSVASDRFSFPWIGRSSAVKIHADKSGRQMVPCKPVLRNDDAGIEGFGITKQEYHWVKDEKQFCCTCGTPHFSTYFCCTLPKKHVKSPNLRFWRQVTWAYKCQPSLFLPCVQLYLVTEEAVVSTIYLKSGNINENVSPKYNLALSQVSLDYPILFTLYNTAG